MSPQTMINQRSQKFTLAQRQSLIQTILSHKMFIPQGLNIKSSDLSLKTDTELHELVHLIYQSQSEITH